MMRRRRRHSGMNLDKIVTSGRLPWQPSDAAHDLDIWWMYEIPLVGTFVIDDRTVLFTSLGDPDRGASVWAYTYLNDDLAGLRDTTFEDVDALDDRVGGLFAGRRAVFALTRDYRIQQWTPTDLVVKEGAGLLAAAVEFMRGILDARRPNDRDRVERIERAQLDTATRELANA
jgi:hypothetical protein